MRWCLPCDWRMRAQVRVVCLSKLPIPIGTPELMISRCPSATPSRFKMALQASDAVFNTGLHIPANVSLMIVLGVLALGVIASLLFPNKEAADEQSK